MGIGKGEHFSQRDIYIDYDFEEVMFRSECATRTLYLKFYGEKTERNISSNNRLFNEALLYGEEITKERYLNGKSRG